MEKTVKMEEIGYEVSDRIGYDRKEYLNFCFCSALAADELIHW